VHCVGVYHLVKRKKKVHGETSKLTETTYAYIIGVFTTHNPLTKLLFHLV